MTIFFNKKKKLFNKILIFYSLITIIFITALCSLSINIIKENESKALIKSNTKLMNEFYQTLDYKYISAQSIYKSIYLNKLYSDSIITFLEYDMKDFIAKSIDNYLFNDVSYYNAIESYMRACLLQDNTIKSISFYSNIKSTLYCYYHDMHSHYYTGDSKHFIDIHNKLQKYSYFSDINIAKNLIPSKDNSDNFSFIFNIKGPDSYHYPGKLIITYNLNTLTNTYDNYSVLDTGNVVISSNKHVICSFIKNYTIDSIDSKQNTIVNTKEYNNLFKIYGIIDNQMIHSSIINTVLIIIITMIISIIAIISFTFLFVRSYSNRLNNITSAIKRISAGDLSVRIETSNKNDELTDIANNFNNMCADIQEYIDKEYIYLVKQKNAELKALQAQINPHFLYNTLEAIRMRAAVNGALDVSEMIYILALFFKKSLKNDIIITIEEEISHCKLYLQLFQIRNNNKINVDFIIEDDILRYSIVKLSLQPIIENSIIHGINIDSADNLITIKGYKEDMYIVLQVIDNGCGIECFTLENIQKMLNNQIKTSNIGIYNVQERLKLIYGDSYDLNIDSQEKKGTTVTIRIPIAKKGDITNV
jgi:two-component system sensor histidine kinase YesM